MKQRILLIVAVLLIATPAFATVTINVTQGAGADINKLTVSYATTGEAVRAFALDFTFTNGANPKLTFGNIADFNKGESTSPGGGYGIFPGQFRNQINPADPNWDVQYYYPVAPPNDVDSNGTGMGESKFIAELGTLYVDSNAPGTSGTLFTVRMDPNSGENCSVLAVTANTVRGGVVLEDGTSVTPTFNLPTNPICLALPECFPSSDPNYARWVAVGKPPCWCGDDVNDNYRQCHGDADLRGQGKGGNIWVYTWDLDVMLAAWNKTDAVIAGQTSTVGTPGKVVPWICADFGHTGQGKKLDIAVYTNDLDILLYYWNNTHVPANDCPHN